MDELRKAIALFDLAAQAKQRDQKIGILDQDDQVVKEIVGIWSVAENPFDLGDLIIFVGSVYEFATGSVDDKKWAGAIVASIFSAFLGFMGGQRAFYS
jgi:hypothetical protein